MDHYTAADIVKLFNVAKKIYNFPFVELREKQVEILKTVMNAKNCFGVLPTGYGKSEIFTLAPLLLDEVRTLFNLQNKFRLIIFSLIVCRHFCNIILKPCRPTYSSLVFS